MFSLICVWINDWVNNRETGDLRRYRAHYDIIVMRQRIPSFACDRGHGSHFKVLSFKLPKGIIITTYISRYSDTIYRNRLYINRLACNCYHPTIFRQKTFICQRDIQLWWKYYILLSAALFPCVYGHIWVARDTTCGRWSVPAGHNLWRNNDTCERTWNARGITRDYQDNLRRTKTVGGSIPYACGYCNVHHRRSMHGDWLSGVCYLYGHAMWYAGD